MRFLKSGLLLGGPKVSLHVSGLHLWWTPLQLPPRAERLIASFGEGRCNRLAHYVKSRTPQFSILQNVAMPNGIVLFSPSRNFTSALKLLKTLRQLFRSSPSDARQGQSYCRNTGLKKGPTRLRRPAHNNDHGKGLADGMRR